MPNDPHKPKRPGKRDKTTIKRRSSTRASGFHSHPDASGRVFYVDYDHQHVVLKAGGIHIINFEWDVVMENNWSGFGGYISSNNAIKIEISSNLSSKDTLRQATLPDWGKFGSLSRESSGTYRASVKIEAIEDNTFIYFNNLGCGEVEHEYVSAAREDILGNMRLYSPEGHFYISEGRIFHSHTLSESSQKQIKLYRKSCNRCNRYLPFNYPNDDKHLSFTNHCIAPSKVPCKHAGFSNLLNRDDGTTLKLHRGLQLECRFCKKFAVNGALNPQRTSAQMKEDAARRRGFELLLQELYGFSHQLKYREGGTELIDDVWENFEKKCFNCGTSFSTSRQIHLDHTRPLALLWPLDKTATALCGSCNSEKSKKYPRDYYTKPGQLASLAEITGISLDELENPTPNLEAIKLLKERVVWLIENFIPQNKIDITRDGKKGSDLFIKALQNAIDESSESYYFNIEEEYNKIKGDQSEQDTDEI